MEHLTVYKTPPVKAEYLITALAGWADAAEAATAGVRYLVRHFKAKRFAELDPEEFYDFSHVRPYTSLTRDDQRRLRWPANELFYCTTGKPKRGLLFFLGCGAQPKMADLRRHHRWTCPAVGSLYGSPRGSSSGCRSPHS